MSDVGDCAPRGYEIVGERERTFWRRLSIRSMTMTFFTFFFFFFFFSPTGFIRHDSLAYTDARMLFSDR